MKFISWNVNGLRACMQKGFLDFFKEIDADIFCLQETKLQEGQIDLNLPGYHQYWNYAEKKGYSGTAIFTKASGQHFAGHPALPACARCRKSACCAVLRRTGADLHAGTRPRQAAWQQNGLRNEGEKQDGTYCS